MASGALAGAALGLASTLAGCATGPGTPVAFNNSPGAVHIDGDLNVFKLFGSTCRYARSATQTASDSQAGQGGDAAANVTTQTGSIGVEQNAALVAALAALDECGEQPFDQQAPEE